MSNFTKEKRTVRRVCALYEMSCGWYYFVVLDARSSKQVLSQRLTRMFYLQCNPIKQPCQGESYPQVIF